MAVMDSLKGAMTGEVSLDPTQTAATIASGVTAFTKILIYFGLTGIVLASIYFIMFHNNIKVLILKHYAGKLVGISNDIGRVLTKTNVHTLTLFWSRKKIPLPGSKFRMRKGKQDFYIFAEDQNADLQPVEPDLETLNSIVAIPQDRRSWLIQDARDQEEKHKKRDDIYSKLQVVLPFFFYIIMFLVTFFAYRYLNASANVIGANLGKIAQTCLGR